MKTILIAHYAHWDQSLGGSEQQLKYLTERLLVKGYKVHFIFPLVSSKPIQKSEIINHPLTYKKLLGPFGKSWFIYKNRIKKLIKEIKPDIIITRAYLSWSGIIADFAKRHNVKHVHFMASAREGNIWEHSISLTKPYDYVERKYVLKTYKGNTQLIAQSDFQVNGVFNNFEIRPIKITQSAPACNPKEIKKSNQKIKVTWIANLKPLKRPEKFLTIVDFFKHNDDLEFSMIGDCKSEKYSEMLSEHKKISNFTYMGALSNDKVNNILNATHILVNTSDSEGFSNTFVQAWLRKVVVLSMSANPDDIITRQKIGFLCPTVKELKSKINFLRNNRTLLYDMGDKAYCYALQNHSLEKNINKIIALLK